MAKSSYVRITALDPEPVWQIDYRCAAPRGVCRVRTLPVLRGKVDALPEPLLGLVLTSDLQGMALEVSDNRLLGQVVAEELELLCDEGELPARDRVAVLLAGDFYANPEADQLGVSGDVWPVWLAFHERFRWVCGVAGNHDRFGNGVSPAASALRDGMHFIDAGQVELDGLKVAGVGGIVGKEARPQRHSEDTQRERVRRALTPMPQLLVMHEGPEVPESGLLGRAVVRELVDGAGAVVVSGHCHWPVSLVELASGTQLLNVDARVIVLTC